MLTEGFLVVYFVLVVLVRTYTRKEINMETEKQEQPVVFADLFLDKDAGNIPAPLAQMGGWCTGPNGCQDQD